MAPVLFMLVVAVLIVVCAAAFWWLVIRERRAEQRESRPPSTPVMDSRDLDELLGALRGYGFWMHYLGNRNSPHTIAAHRERSPDYTDVLILRGHGHAVAYRAITTDPRTDIFWPDQIVWHYLATPLFVLRALYALPTPDHPDAVHVGYPPPADCRISPELRRRSHLVPPPGIAKETTA